MEERDPMKLTEIIKLDDKGLITAVIQHVTTGQVLMVGYMNEESLAITLNEQRACFWSRSRQKLWRKGESSGNFLHVREVRVDCDPVGPTCHTNETSCFYRTVDFDGNVALSGDGVAKE
jgi:phosphoribosyl-AMP cyclohydrolase